MSVGSRMNFHANALRAKGLPFSIEDGRIRNLYTIRVQNKSDRASTYHIRLEDQVDGIEMIMPQPDLHLDSLEDGRSPVFFYLDRDSYTEPFILTLSVMDSLSGVVTNVKVTFRGP